MKIRKKAYSRDAVTKEVTKMINCIMKPYEKEELDYTPEVFFKEIDSIRIIEIVVLAEKKFKIAFSTEQLSVLENKEMESFVDIIMERLEQVA